MKQNPTIYKIDSSFDMNEALTGIQSHLGRTNRSYIQKELPVNDFTATLLIMSYVENTSDWFTFFPIEYVDGINSINFIIN